MKFGIIMIFRIFGNFTRRKNVIGGNITDSQYIINFASVRGIILELIHVGMNNSTETVSERLVRRTFNLLEFIKITGKSKPTDLNVFFISGLYSYFEKVLFCKITGLRGKKIFLLRAGIFFDQLISSPVLLFIFKCLTNEKYIFSIQCSKFNLFQGLGLNNTVKTLPNWTIESVFNLNEKLNSWIGPPKFVFIGRFDSKKGIDEIVSFLNKCEIERFPIDFLFLGHGPLESYLLNLRYSFVNIRITSFKSKSELKVLVRGCNYCLLPSKSEGLPNALFESWEFGIIPIFSSVGCVDEYLKDGENGFIWDSVESVYRKIVCLQNDIKTVKQMLMSIQLYLKNNKSTVVLEKLFDLENSEY